MASLTDILTTAQQGVVAANNLTKQMTGTLNNINGQLTNITSQLSSINTQLSSIHTSISSINGQLTAFEAAWTPYTPAITVFSGSIVATSTGRFNQIGKTIFVSVNIEISSGANGAGVIYATTPINPNPANTYVIPGREYRQVGKMLQGWIGEFTQIPNVIEIANYDNSYPATVNGAGLALSGVYEST